MVALTRKQRRTLRAKEKRDRAQKKAAEKRERIAERQRRRERKRMLARESKAQKEERRRKAAAERAAQKEREKAARAAAVAARAEARAKERLDAKREKADAKEREKRQRAEQARMHEMILRPGTQQALDEVQGTFQRVVHQVMRSHHGIKMPEKSKDDGRLRAALETLVDVDVEDPQWKDIAAKCIPQLVSSSTVSTPVHTPRAAASAQTSAPTVDLQLRSGLHSTVQLDEALRVFDFLGTFAKPLGLPTVPFDKFLTILRTGLTETSDDDSHLSKTSLTDSILGALLDLLLSKIYLDFHRHGTEATKRIFAEHPLTPQKSGRPGDIPGAPLKGMVNGATWRVLVSPVLRATVYLNALGSAAQSLINARAPDADLLELVFKDFPGAMLVRPPVMRVAKGLPKVRDREPGRAFQAALASGGFFARCEVSVAK